MKRLEALEAKEKERADAQLTKEQLLEKERDEARAAAEKATLDANARLLKSAVLLKAQSMNFEHPADAFNLAKAENALSALEQSDKGEYDEKAIEAALTPLIGRLPVKAQSSGNGTPKLPPEKPKKSEPEKTGRSFRHPF